MRQTFFRKKIFLIWAILCISPVYTHAYSPHNLYMTTLSILSYVKWNTPAPTLCVIDNANIANQFQQVNKQLKYQYSIESIRLENFQNANCNAIFFTNTSPSAQQQFLNKFSSNALLSFSTNNKDCEIGSAFCLDIKPNGDTSFKINLDALTRSRIHVDPRVLLLAKNVENQ